MERYMAEPEDRLAAKRAYERGKLVVSWGAHTQPFLWWKGWAKRQGWSIPLFIGAKKAFIQKMLESDENFALVVEKSGGIDVWIYD